MRFPKLSELDRDQARIYQGAPTDGTILVLGPPGTGKTVIAFHRAETLLKKGQAPKVIMFNKVLSRYTSKRGNVAKGVEVSTFHQWVYSWWKRLTNNRHASPPKIVGNNFDFDWHAIQNQAMSRLTTHDAASHASWGHLIIDEGQDFPEQMYCSLNLIMAMANGHKVKPSIAMSVYADENQRLSPGKNSTTDQIRTSLGLSKDDKNVFHLKKNYRNTLEIARLASCFYVGLPTGKPDLPTKSGLPPVISNASHDTEGKNLNAFVEKIVRYAKINKAMEIGVLTPNNKIRQSMFNRLVPKLQQIGMVVQSYKSEDDVLTADSLSFDTPGHLTVLNFQSAKGLEFDAVFIVDPGKLYNMGSAMLDIKMTLYVMCSRAREFLNIMLVNDASASQIMEFLSTQQGKYSTEDL